MLEEDHRKGSRMYGGGRARRGVVLDGECGATSAESGGGARLFADGEVRGSGRARSPCGGATKKRRGGTDGDGGGTGAKREGGGKAGRPGIDRLKKGWIFLPLGGGPAV